MAIDGWGFAPVGELVENLDSRRVPVRASDRKPGPYPYYGASGIVDWVDGYLFEGLHLLVAEDGENLRSRKTPIAFLADGKFWVNNHAHILRGKRDVADTRFLMYALERADVSGYLTGSTQPKLTQRNLHDIPLRVPSYPEQVAIAEVLGALDEKVRLNRRIVGTLEDIAQAVFRERFGQTPTGGVLPNGWRAGTVADVATQVRATIKPGDKPDELFVHYSLPAFDTGNGAPTVFGSDIKSGKTVVPDGAVLVSKLNPRIPRVWLPSHDESEGTPVSSTEFLVWTPTNVCRSFLFCLFSSALFQSRLVELVTGTSGSHQRVQPAVFAAMSVLIPDASALADFDSEARPLLEQASNLRRENRTLVEMRNTMLPRLMSGELRVGEAEKAVEAVL